MKIVTIAALSLLALPLLAQQKPTPMPAEPPKSSVITSDEIYTMAASISVAKRFCGSGTKQGLKEVNIYSPEDAKWFVLTCHDASAEGVFSLKHPDFINVYKQNLDSLVTLQRNLDKLGDSIDKATKIITQGK